MLTAINYRELHRLIDLIYVASDDQGYSWPTLARRAGLNHATVYRLGNYETKYPRVQTVMMLARAVGFRFELKGSLLTHHKLKVVS